MKNSQRISHTHLQFAQATTQAKIAKEYVLPTLKTGREKEKKGITKYILNAGFVLNSK